MSKYSQQLQQETVGLQVSLAAQKAKKHALGSKKKTMRAKMLDLSLDEKAYELATRIHTKTCNQYGEVLKQITKLETAIEKRMALLDELDHA